MLVYTLGYEGKSLPSFLEELQRNSVSLLIDVREHPFSRKAGFSRRALSSALEVHGIRYMHLGSLGSPSGLRKKLAATHDYDSFFYDYRMYLRTKKRELEAIIEEAAREVVCLMCYEHDPEMCHRSIVAEELEKKLPGEMRIQHLVY